MRRSHGLVSLSIEESKFQSEKIKIKKREKKKKKREEREKKIVTGRRDEIEVSRLGAGLVKRTNTGAGCTSSYRSTPLHILTCQQIFN